MTPIRLNDSLTKKKVPFEPLVPGKVGMYVCGPTPYTPAHIGHAYSAISFDTIRRALVFLGYDVRYVRNVTDIDDKIINRAKDTGEDPLAMSKKFAAEYNRDMAMFNVMAPTVEPTVTGHIPHIIAITERLIANGHAYASEGDIYYDVTKFPPYGRLSGRHVDELLDGEHNTRKRSAADFALWKAAKPGEPAWDSPWGRGRPGWHIECSAMTEAHLGTTFDIHAGGRDLIFPHHENEIAQSQGAYGEGTFARYWLHNGFLNFNGEKMARSVGNVMNAVEIARAVGGEAFRYYCAKHHYASPINFEVFSETTPPRFFRLEEADRELAYFYGTLQKLDAFTDPAGNDGPVMKEAEALVPAARAALADDFNAPAAIAVLYDAARHANKLLDQAKGVDKQLRKRTLARYATDLRAVGRAVGLFEATPAAYLADRRTRLVKAKNIDVERVAQLIGERTAARASKDFERADAIRKELAAMNVELHDLTGGTDWSVLEVGRDEKEQA